MAWSGLGDATEGPIHQVPIECVIEGLVRGVIGECTISAHFGAAMAFLSGAATRSLEAPIREDHAYGHRRHREAENERGCDKGLHTDLLGGIGDAREYRFRVPLAYPLFRSR